MKHKYPTIAKFKVTAALDPQRLREIELAADVAFWAVVAEMCPEIQSGDEDLGQVMQRLENNKRDIANWYKMNEPEGGASPSDPGHPDWIDITKREQK